MKTSGIFLLLTLASAVAIAAAPISPSSIKKLTAKIDTSGKAIRETILYGPFRIKASNDTHTAPPTSFKLDPNSDLLTGKLAGLCSNCMILEAKADIANADGSKVDIASGVYSHHVIMTDIGRTPVRPNIKAICKNGKPGGFNFQLMGGMMGSKGAKSPSSGSAAMPGMAHSGHSRRQMPGTGGSVFVGQGDEGSATTFQTPGGKLKSGFYISPEESMSMMAEVINYNSKPQDLFISLEYEYIPNLTPRPKEYYDVGFGAINVSPCETMNLRPPPDKPVKYTSPSWQVGTDGYLINVKPHLHDGGVNMTFFVNGKESCSSSAVYGGTDGGLAVGDQKWETITAYTPCHEEIKVAKGDNVTMEAWYDLTKHRLRPQADDHSEGAEGMALALFLFARPPTP